jgi:hypothetical protein
MMESDENQVQRLERRVRRLQWAVMLLGVAVVVSFLYPRRSQKTTLDRAGVFATLMTWYQVERPRPPGPVEDPAVAAWDIELREWIRSVRRTFPDAYRQARIHQPLQPVSGLEN